MLIKNTKDTVNEKNEHVYTCDIVHDDGKIEHIELLQYIVDPKGAVALNPEVVEIKEKAARQRVVEKAATKAGVAAVATNGHVNGSKKNTELKEENKKQDQEKKDKLKKNIGRLVLIAGIGLGSFAVGSLFKGCGPEKGDSNEPQDGYNVTDASYNPSGEVKDDVISSSEALADIKKIEIELNEKGVLEKGSPAYDEILDGARALYVRVNAEELSKEAIAALGFKDLEPIQIIAKSFDVTGELMTHSYGQSAKSGKDYIKLSIFCHDEQDKKIVDQMHDIAVESLTTDSKAVAEKNASVIGDYYKNLKPAEFKYSVGVGESVDAVLNLYAEEVIQKAGQFGVDKKGLEAIRDLPGYGNYSYEYRTLSAKCQAPVVEQAPTR